MAAARSATDHALNIQEVLEAILHRLPIKDILVVAPRVCKQWKTNIDTSPKPRQALFFEPLPCNELQLVIHREANPRIQYWMENEEDSFIYTVHRFPFITKIFKETTCTDGWAAVHRPEASWRRMLLFQPPVLFSSKVDSRLRLGELLAVAPDRYLPRCHIRDGYEPFKRVEFGNEVAILRRPKPSCTQ